MSKADHIDISTRGTKELQAAITRFAHEVRRDSASGYMYAIRQAAAFIAQSLSKVTKIAKPNAPRFHKIQLKELRELGARSGMTDDEIKQTWNAIKATGGAYIGDKGYVDRITQTRYRPPAWQSVDPRYNLNGRSANVNELKHRYRYHYTGLAKASWLTMKQQSRKSPSSGNFNQDIANVLPKVAVVWVRPSDLRIHFSNRLSYIRQAMPSGAVEEAVGKATNRLIGMTNAQIEKAKAKAGLK